MVTLETIDKGQLREVLCKNWMTHDAMWLYHCVQAVGMEKTNAINRAAVRSMAGIEGKRLKKLMGLNEIRNFEDLKKLFEGSYAIINADFMAFTYSFPEENLLRWKTEQCFAYDGIKRMGRIEEYECGIMERIYGWLDGLGIAYTVEPDTTECLMHTQGICMRDIRVYLP